MSLRAQPFACDLVGILPAAFLADAHDDHDDGTLRNGDLVNHPVALPGRADTAVPLEVPRECLAQLQGLGFQLQGLANDDLP